jgi:hypothetical protein
MLFLTPNLFFSVARLVSILLCETKRISVGTEKKKRARSMKQAGNCASAGIAKDMYNAKDLSAVAELQGLGSAGDQLVLDAAAEHGETRVNK